MLKRKLWMVLIILGITVLAACGNESENGEETEELTPLEVEFLVPEKVEVDENFELEAIVTYGDEDVTDADEVTFEYWRQGNEDETTKIEATNNGDGTYTTDLSIATDGVYEIFAHTTAKGLHTMPKKSITIGEGTVLEQEDAEHVEGEHNHGAHDHGATEGGFALHFVDPGAAKQGEEVNLTVHLQMDGEPLAQANVRYEVVNDSSDIHEWIETEELTAGEYDSTYVLEEAGIYNITIHVENDEGLHEHEEYTIEVE
ncbi:FixH family protein [Oceanobacillus bengalensis]|uniref:YtkA-like domain-containing protein n=1 Tax=Oceanobacillus bengalensis TaxID=1435466 RepID=A0A494YZT3_9BACI|nr:FixH family protein [Oceanobacillus bengalensis]RKQ15513.1 hypothetical protein D8M05_09585 [Oceanobacillus bengalensis]